MSRFIPLTDIEPAGAGGTIWINMDIVTAMYRVDYDEDEGVECTCLQFEVSGLEMESRVVETPEVIMELMLLEPRILLSVAKPKKTRDEPFSYVMRE